MKKKGNTSDFTEDRDNELQRSFMEMLRTGGEMPLRDMFGAAAARPASRFWVSETRAAIVIGAMMRGHEPERMYRKRREMFEEIYRRVREKMAADPALLMTHAVNQTVYEPAPEFYLTPESARSIIYRIRQRRRRMSMIKKTLDSKRKGEREERRGKR